jgi:hypothetical protein
MISNVCLGKGIQAELTGGNFLYVTWVHFGKHKSIADVDAKLVA